MASCVVLNIIMLGGSSYEYFCIYTYYCSVYKYITLLLFVIWIYLVDRVVRRDLGERMEFREE